MYTLLVSSSYKTACKEGKTAELEVWLTGFLGNLPAWVRLEICVAGLGKIRELI